MKKRLSRLLAQRLRRAAVTLAAPEDFEIWRIEDEMRHARRPSGVAQGQILSFCRRLAPCEVDGHSKVRLGGANDGGYVFIDDFDEVSTVISCGISNDVSCDLAFAELGKDVVQFDHTVEGPPEAHPRFKFHKQAIDELQEIPGSARLSDVIRGVGDASRCDLLLKIDIEGGEWTTFAKIAGKDLARCRQIACEFHGVSRLIDAQYFSTCSAAVATISENFFPAHIHANNFRGFVRVAGVPIPEVFEVTFVNRRFYSPGPRQQAGPLAVDAPNDADVPDLFLGSPFSLDSR